MNKNKPDLLGKIKKHNSLNVISVCDLEKKSATPKKKRRGFHYFTELTFHLAQFNGLKPGFGRNPIFLLKLQAFSASLIE